MLDTISRQQTNSSNVPGLQWWIISFRWTLIPSSLDNITQINSSWWTIILIWSCYISLFLKKLNFLTGQYNKYTNIIMISVWKYITLLSLSSSHRNQSKSLYLRLTLDSFTLNTGKLVWKKSQTIIVRKHHINMSDVVITTNKQYICSSSK